MLYTKPLGKNAFHLLWTEMTEVIFSMIKVALQQFREPKRHTTKREQMTQKSTLSMWTSCEDHLQQTTMLFVVDFSKTAIFYEKLLLHRKHFCTSRYFSRVTSSTHQLLFQSSCFFRAATFLGQLRFQNTHFFSPTIL